MKFNTSLVLISMLCCSGKLCAQADSFYISEDGRKCDSANAAYFRIAQRQSNGLYQVRDYYLSGMLQMTGTVTSLDIPNINEGHFVYYYPNGNVASDVNYLDDALQGSLRYFDSAGQLRYEGYTDRGRYNGLWNQYYSNGKLYWTIFWKHGRADMIIAYRKNGKAIMYKTYENPRYIAADGSSVKYKHLDAMPAPTVNLDAYFAGNLIYPAPMRGQPRTVYVNFMVATDGSLEDIMASNPCCQDYYAAAIKAIKAMPKWKPAMYDGKPVNVFYYGLPVRFK